MKKLFRTCMEQTGIAIFIGEHEEEIYRPLFSNSPCEEAREIAFITGDRLRDVFYSNNLLDYKIEDIIRDYMSKSEVLPENYVDELVSGFPFVTGSLTIKGDYNTNYIYCYR